MTQMTARACSSRRRRYHCLFLPFCVSSVCRKPTRVLDLSCYIVRPFRRGLDYEVHFLCRTLNLELLVMKGGVAIVPGRWFYFPLSVVLGLSRAKP